MSSGRASARIWKDQTRSRYETPILKILVGEEEALFKIHEGLLQRTSFFAEHGRPQPKLSNQTGQPQNITRAPQGNAADRLFTDVDDEEEEHDNGSSQIVDLTDNDAHYELKGKFYYSRDTFNILVRHLNDALPITPTNQDECISLFKAYALAQHYQVDNLQNQIIDTLQTFYSKNTIPISDVVYVVNHWGDNISCFLIAYLIEQAAYEMAIDWNRYRNENEEIVALFASGHKIILEQLFQAAMKYTKPIPTADPARHKRDWRLQTC